MAVAARVVVINDDPKTLRLLAALFMKQDFRVIPYASAEDALAEMRRDGPPDLIVTDLHMPSIDGWRLCRLLRSQEYGDFNDVPVVVVSSTFSGEDEWGISRELGASGFVALPEDMEKLPDIARTLLAGEAFTERLQALVVEDSPVLAQLLTERLRMAGYDVHVAPTGRDAERLIRNRRPLLVILDYHLPDMPGDAVMDIIIRVIPQAVVIVMTGDTTAELATYFMRKGADAFVRKPFDLEYLVELCERCRRARVLLRVEDRLDERTRELARSEERYANLYHSTPVMLHSVDADGIIIQVSNYWLEALGYTHDDVVGHPISQFLLEPPAGHARQGVFPEFAHARHCHNLERQVTKKNGEVLDVLMSAIAEFDEEGRYLGSLSVITDISDRKRIENTLRESEAKLSQAVQLADLGTWTWQVETDYFVCSEDSLRLFGNTSKNERVPLEVFYHAVHREDRDRVRQALKDALLGNAAYNIEFRFFRSRREMRYAHIIGDIEHDADGKPERMIGVVQDITALRQAEEERRALESQVQHAQKLESLGVLAGGIAHDFNNLLTGILGNADLALMDLAPISPVRESIEQIEIAARRAAELTRQMLAYSGKGHFIIQPLKLPAVIEEITPLLEASISKKSRLQFRFEPETPPIDGDPAQIRQVIMNLVVNASEAIGDTQGLITVAVGQRWCNEAYFAETYAKPELPPGQYVSLQVTDTGCGMTPATMKKLFDPFFTTKFTGRGLGLAAVLGIVRGHRGAIHVESELDKGSTFHLVFPAGIHTASDTRRELAEVTAYKGEGLVLLVDDESAVRDYGKKLLERLGFQVLVAEHGVAALELFRVHAADVRLVLLDMMMPIMDGEETFQELRKVREDVCVILASGYTEQVATKRFEGKGLAGFIQKPFRIRDLVALIRSVIETAAPSST